MDFYQKLKKIEQDIIHHDFSTALSRKEFSKNYVKNNSSFVQFFLHIRNLPEEERKTVGKQLNRLKELARKRWKTENEKEKKKEDNKIVNPILPPGKENGHSHLLSIIEEEVAILMAEMGFYWEKSSIIEDEWHNFSALNFEEHHPARAMMDTFFLEDGSLLRTHTSPIQIRAMEKKILPIRIASIGQVFRNETLTSRSHHTFHQVEGFYLSKDVSYRDLVSVLSNFFKKFFFDNIKLRMRPSFFPFTEPSIEVDVACFLCEEKGCKVCKKTGWIEVAGAGMIDPQVLINCNIDPNIYTGYAFGAGLERLAMLRYKIDDVRLFLQNDLHFIKQFRSTL